MSPEISFLKLCRSVSLLMAGILLWPSFVYGEEIASSEPPTSWIDPDTGHKVLRLTSELDATNLYFNLNCYTPDGRQLIYVTRDGICLLDLATLKTKKIDTGKFSIVEAGRKTSSVFYTKIESAPGGSHAPTRSLFAVHAETGAVNKIADLPPHGVIYSINADETLAVGTYTESDHGFINIGATVPGQPGVQKRKADLMEERLAQHIPTTMFVVDLRSGQAKDILKTTDWLGHVLFSPTDPTLIMYCHEGPWHKVDRIWTIRSDGSGNTLIHKRTMEMEVAGHEFWSHDGKTIWYDLQTPRSQVFWVAGYNVVTGERIRYSLQRDEWSVHFNVSNDGTLFCGDGADPGKIARAPNGRWIYLFRPELTKDSLTVDGTQIKRGVFHAERLVGMHKHDYMSEPNVTFTPDKKYVVFRSNMLGATYIFAVEVGLSETKN